MLESGRHKIANETDAPPHIDIDNVMTKTLALFLRYFIFPLLKYLACVMPFFSLALCASLNARAIFLPMHK